MKKVFFSQPMRNVDIIEYNVNLAKKICEFHDWKLIDSYNPKLKNSSLEEVRKFSYSKLMKANILDYQ